MARVRREPARWPAWRHSPDGESAIFNSEDEVPPGWFAAADPAFAPTHTTEILDPATLAALLEAKGVKVLGHWSAAHMKELLTR